MTNILAMQYLDASSSFNRVQIVTEYCHNNYTYIIPRCLLLKDKDPSGWAAMQSMVDHNRFSSIFPNQEDIISITTSGGNNILSITYLSGKYPRQRYSLPVFPVTERERTRIIGRFANTTLSVISLRYFHLPLKRAIQ